MFELDSESPEMMAHYRAKLEIHRDIAASCGIPEFSRDLRRDLAVFLPNKEDLQLVEVVTRLGDFGNTDDLVSMRKEVSRLLKKRGVRLPRGKRTAPGLREFVECVAPVLLALGLPLATGGRSKLVRALQMIAIELDLSGDPRDELRRLKRLKTQRDAYQRKVAAKIFASVWKNLAPPDNPM